MDENVKEELKKELKDLLKNLKDLKDLASETTGIRKPASIKIEKKEHGAISIESKGSRLGILMAMIAGEIAIREEFDCDDDEYNMIKEGIKASIIAKGTHHNE